MAIHINPTKEQFEGKLRPCQACGSNKSVYYENNTTRCKFFISFRAHIGVYEHKIEQELRKVERAKIAMIKYRLKVHEIIQKEEARAEKIKGKK